MSKKDIIKSIASILVIIVLAVLVVNMNNIASPKVQKADEEQTTPKLTGGEPNAAGTTATATDYGKCLSGYGKSPNTIVFVHSDNCPHCRNMVPIIQELEKEGYKFYWAESSDSSATELVNNCFSNLLSGYVPQFICPKTGKEQTGEMGKEDLRKFAEDCN